MIKVLLIGPLPYPMNGCSYANSILLSGLEKIGLKTDYIDTSANEVSEKQGHRFSFKKATLFARVYFKIYKIFSAEVVYFTPGQTFFGLLKYSPFIFGSRLLRVPYVLHIHGNYMGTHYRNLSGVKRNLFKSLVRGAAAGIVLSGSLKENFKDLLDDGKVRIVENFAGDDLICRAAPNKSVDHLRILYFSNVMREKGILELCEACLVLKRTGIPFHLTIAGRTDLEVKENFELKLSELGSSATYAGPIFGAEKRRLLFESNVFVLPTYYEMEGQPIAILEAMAAGNIVVTTEHAGIVDIVTSANGYFVPKRDSQILAEVLRNISVDISGAVDKFSGHNAQYVSEHFTEKLFCQKVKSVLVECVDAVKVS